VAQLMSSWQQSAARRREGLLGAALLLAAATILRIGWPALTEFKFSEARLEALVLELTRNGRLPLIGVPSSAGFDHSPLSVYLYLPPFLLTTNPIPATVYGGLVGVGAVALGWWFSRRWSGGGRAAACTAGLLLATSPWLVAFSRKIWQVVFVPLLALAVVGLLVSALIAEPSADSQRRQQWNLAWALVLFAVLVQVHPSALSLAPAIALWLILFWRRVRPRPLVVGAALAAVTAAPFVAHQIRSGWPVLAALGSLPEGGWDLSAVHLAWEVITGRGIGSLAGGAYPLLQAVPQLGWFFNLVGWLTVTSALWLGWRTVRRWRTPDAEQREAAQVDLVLLTWLTVPVLFNLRHSLELYLHFFALVAPAAYLVVGRAVQALLLRVRPMRLGVAVVAALTSLATVQVVALILMGRFVATHDTAGGFGTPLGQYLAVARQAVAMATDQGAAEVLVVGQGDSPVVDETPAIFDVLLRDRVAYRFVDGGSAALFPSYPAVAILAPEAGEGLTWYHSLPVSSIALEGGYALMDLQGAWPGAGFEPVPGFRLFENGIEAQGYTWQADTGSTRTVRFWLLWQVLWLSPDETHFFVRMTDQSGSGLGQTDISGYPAALRKKGDRVVSLFDITKQAADAATVPSLAQIGQYLYPQVVSVPLIDQAGNPAAHAATVQMMDRGPQMEKQD
jgi:hypothetical protein